MKIVFFSKTHNTERFIEKVGFESLEGLEAVKGYENDIYQEPFILITYTTGFGEVPKEVKKFVNHNKDFIQGVVSSGNRNWGTLFGAAGDEIAQRCNVPLLMKFELAGTLLEVNKFRNLLINKGQEFYGA